MHQVAIMFQVGLTTAPHAAAAAAAVADGCGPKIKIADGVVVSVVCETGVSGD